MRKLIPFAILLLSVAAFAQDTGAFDPDAEATLVKLLNQEREKAGLPALHVDDRLTAAAREHSQLLLQHHLLSHQFGGEPSLPKRLAAHYVRFDRDGENVAFDVTAEQAHDGLMHSPPHRENILSPGYDAVGIGVVRGEKFLWITQDFARRMTDMPEKQAADAVAKAFEAMRRAAGAPPVNRIEISSLHNLACNMAKKDGLDVRGALSLPDSHTAVAFTESVPSRLPSSAQRLRDDRGFQKYAVGVCFKDSPQYPAGTYWILLVTF